MKGFWNNKRVVLATFAAVLIGAAACAPQMRIYPAVDRLMAAADFGSAMELVEKNKEKYGERDYLIYLMDQAILSHYAGDYARSAKILREADQEFEERYTESITKCGATWLVNDLTADYRGEDFESVMINLFNAINYAKLGKTAEALVEARRVDNRLNLINSKYDEDKKNVYKEDGFVRFLMGILYEAGGTSQDLNDAYISYKKAYKIYKDDFSLNYGTPPPPALKENLLSVAAFMGTDEWSHWKRSLPRIIFITLEQRSKDAEVYVIHYNGKAPVKVEEAIMVPIRHGHVIKIAFPRYEERPCNISSSVICASSAAGKSIYRSHSALVGHIGRIAMKNLENRKARVKAKAIARATTKYLASKAAEKAATDKKGEWAGLLVKFAANVASVATEQADIRHWRLLPAEIRVGRTLIPPGKYSGEIDFLDDRGAIVGSKVIKPFSVRAGKKRFFVFRTLN